MMPGSRVCVPGLGNLQAGTSGPTGSTTEKNFRMEFDESATFLNQCPLRCKHLGQYPWTGPLGRSAPS